MAELIMQGIEKEAAGLSETEIREAQLIKKELRNSLILKDFYGALIRSYTQETFLYDRVNKLLRQEDWEGMKNLLPYIYYLLDSLSVLFDNQDDFILSLKEKSSTISLYRGCNLSEEHILQYVSKLKKKECFSWPSFTSFSADEKMARMFCQACPPPGLSPVIFMIQMPLSEYEDWMCIECSWQFFWISEYSVHQNEEEVVMASGTVLKVEDISIKDGCYYIRLRHVFHVDYEFCSEAARQSGFQAILDYKFDNFVALPGLNDEILEPILNSLLTKPEVIEDIELESCDLSSLGMNKFMEALLLMPQLTYLRIHSSPHSPLLESMRIFADRLS